MDCRPLTRFSILPIGTLLLSAVAPGQTGYQTTPKGFLSRSGDHQHAFFAMHPDARCQWIDGTIQGTPLTLRGVAFRSRRGGQMGRSFSRLTIDAAPANASATTRSFAGNQLSTPTRVFDRPYSLPSIPVGRSQGTGWDVQMPFSRPYVHDGRHGLSLDFQFHGGVLHNGGTWSWRTPPAYTLDADKSLDARGAKSGVATNHGLGTCVDSAAPRGRPAAPVLSAFTYGSQYTSTAYRSRTTVSGYGNYLAPNSSALMVFGLGVNRSGTRFPGVACERLHVNLAMPYVTIPLATDSRGRTPLVRFLGPTGIPARATYTHRNFVAQMAWSDSSTSAPRLSMATENYIPPQPPTRYRPTRYLFSSHRSALSIHEPRFDGPLVRYTR